MGAAVSAKFTANSVLELLTRETGRHTEAGESTTGKASPSRKASSGLPKCAGLSDKISPTRQLDLGTLLSRTGRHTEAEKAYRESLAIGKKLTEDFPNVADYRGSLAALYHYEPGHSPERGGADTPRPKRSPGKPCHRE